jgi:F-type H+-transporting ATPase subunit gamma
VTRRRDFEQQRDSLGEIGEILSSMKTLAYMETRKLSRFLDAQLQVVRSIREVADDFLEFHPGMADEPQEATTVYVVVGSERGFCGDFNRALIERLNAARGDEYGPPSRVVLLGHKLHTLWPDKERAQALMLEGASVAEDVPAVMQRLIDELGQLSSGMAGLALYGIYHENHSICVDRLLPPFAERQSNASVHRNPPLLNVSPQAFLRDLVDHYLFAALNHMLYTSLMAENQRRVSHLEGAVRHLDEQARELTTKCKALRQEEIVEEIEVILLSAIELDENGEPQSTD